ncbi:phosphogluconate dehydratase [Leucothrix arctica]|uniref:Phosphogluconate dehydratase n=1 Tax=Leucothrix arctica TaxID=1481894 RepID=A0A317C924_9GAMM|nr:phosphogluconate dehydratase [Leucothrix arctica]PWQ94859.1 phosphogluconate dehydratase [Leucothrix arctica]
MTILNAVVDRVTDRIRKRSTESRSLYLKRMQEATKHTGRHGLGCTNLAHGVAAAPASDKIMLVQERPANLGIITSYNDMLSAHSPYARYPDLIKEAARRGGAVAQVAGATPAMCDGVTQGEPGMELSLFSRDLIAMSTGIALSHNVFDAGMYLGICDKIVPGLLIGALRFGHLPAIFIPSGPMGTGISNSDKAKVRQRYAEGKAGRAELLASELAAYHSEGTCTFYGTANSNQMLMEIMGLHVPGAAFVPPHGGLRDTLTNRAVDQLLAMTKAGGTYKPLTDIIDERAIVNGMIGLMATGGSTNHTIHLVAIASAAGIKIDWDDFTELSEVVPLIAKVYPNGQADINQFHAVGGVGTVIRELLEAGLLHENVETVSGSSLADYATEPFLEEGKLTWRPSPAAGDNAEILSTVAKPFREKGGLKLLAGNLGRSVTKISAVDPENWLIEAPCRIFDSQEAVQEAFKANELDHDVVVVVRFQGPQANGMPELHKLMPVLGVLQDRGQRVALVTDGRLSGASGKVPTAIHMTPECLVGGGISRLRDGDVIRVDCENGTVGALVDDAEWNARELQTTPSEKEDFGFGRELFSAFRKNAGDAEAGACVFDVE